MSDQGRNIDDLIRNGFDAEDDGFEIDSWSKMEQQLDTRAGIDKLIIHAFNQVPEDLPSSAWPEIKEELDINTVWNRINIKLTKKKRRVFIWWNVAAASFILLLAAYVFQDSFKDAENSSLDAPSTLVNKAQKQGIKSDEQSFENINDYRVVTDEHHISPTLNDEEVSNNLNYSSETIGNELGNQNENDFNEYVNRDSEIENGYLTDNLKSYKNDNEVVNSSFELIQPLQLSSINRLKPPNYECEIPEIEIQPLGQNNKPLHQRRWILGAFVLANYSIISDATSRAAFSGNSLTSNNFAVSIDYGIYGQFYTNRNYFVQTEFYWNSKIKRSTQKYDHFEYVNHKVELNYYKLSLSVGKSLSMGRLKHTWFNPALGVFGAYMKNGIEYEQNEVLNTIAPYKKWNYGLQLDLGIQHEFNRFVVGYGLNSSFGLSNIFQGTEQQSSFLNVSRTFTNGVYFRLGFKL